jgi:hypothetical protein
MTGTSSRNDVQREMNARVLATLPAISIIFALAYAVYAALHGRFLALLRLRTFWIAAVAIATP